VLTVCFTPKGGAGGSVVAAALALQVAASGQPCLLVDLAGDLAAVLGAAEDDGVGDWMAAADDVPIDALRALETPVVDNLRLLRYGNAEPADWSEDRRQLAISVFAARATAVIVDAGTGPRWWPEQVTTIAVVRSCYLGVRRLTAAVRPADHVVVVEEAGRVLRRRDIEEAIGRPALAIPWDPAVARAVDAGLLAHRLPRSLRGLRPLLDRGVA
jgi:hypothetical protein